MRKNQLGQKKTNYAKDTQCVSEKKKWNQALFDLETNKIDNNSESVNQ